MYDSELHDMLSKVADSVVAARAAERDAERKAAIAKAEEKFVKEDHERDMDKIILALAQSFAFKESESVFPCDIELNQH